MPLIGITNLVPVMPHNSVTPLRLAGITNLVPKEWKRRDLLGAHKQADGSNYWLGLSPKPAK